MKYFPATNNFQCTNNFSWKNIFLCFLGSMYIILPQVTVCCHITDGLNGFDTYLLFKHIHHDDQQQCCVYEDVKFIAPPDTKWAP